MCFPPYFRCRKTDAMITRRMNTVHILMIFLRKEPVLLQYVFLHLSRSGQRLPPPLLNVRQAADSSGSFHTHFRSHDPAHQPDIIDCRAAVENPVDVFTKSAPASFAARQAFFFSSSVRRQVSRITFTSALPSAACTTASMSFFT